jgi:hypothetical protein
VSSCGRTLKKSKQLPHVQLPRSVSEFTWQNSKKSMQLPQVQLPRSVSELTWQNSEKSMHLPHVQLPRSVSEYTWKKRGLVSVHQAKLLLNDQRKIVQLMRKMQSASKKIKLKKGGGRSSCSY